VDDGAAGGAWCAGAGGGFEGLGGFEVGGLGFR